MILTVEVKSYKKLFYKKVICITVFKKGFLIIKSRREVNLTKPFYKTKSDLYNCF